MLLYTNDIFGNLLAIWLVTTVISIGLYYVTRSGSELINASIEKEKKVNELLLKLQETMNIIKENTVDLNSDIFNCNDNLMSAKESSNGIMITAESVTKSVIEQAGSMKNICHMTDDADNKIIETVNIVSGIKEIFTKYKRSYL